MFDIRAEGVPDPGEVKDLPGFIEALRQLRIVAGHPSYRVLARRVGPLLRPPQTMAQSTIANAFQPQRRRLDLDLVVAVVRALGLPEAEVVRWRTACVRIHAEPVPNPPPGALRQLPADLATFTGRERELAYLMEAVTPLGAESPSTVVISAIEGMAGVGKTQLAVHAAHELVRAGRFADIQLYVNLRGFDAAHPPADPADVLDAFLRQLGVTGSQIPASLDGRAAMFRDRIHGKAALILLDNASDENQVQDLIPGGPGCLVLITSRRTLAGLDGATARQLDVLSRAEAVELLARIAGADRIGADPAAAVEIVECCGRLPLAVALAAARLRSRPAWTPTDLVGHLRGGRLRAWSAGSRSVEAVFDLSYLGLSVSSRRLFRLLSLHVGDDFSAEATAALAGTSPGAVREALELLQDEHLLLQRVPGRYELHDLLKQYSTECCAADEPPADALSAELRLMHWYLKAVDAANAALANTDHPVSPAGGPDCGDPPAFDSYDQALAWLDQEAHSITAIVPTAFDRGSHDLAWRAAVSLRWYFRLRTHLESWVRTHELALESVRILGDDPARARVLNSLVVMHIERRDYQESLACGEQVVRIHRASGDDVGLLSGLINLSVSLLNLQRLSESIGASEEAEAIARRQGDTRRIGLALSNKAYSQSLAGDLEAAAATNLQALTLSRESGDRIGEGITLNNLGDVHIARRDWESALDCFRQALQVRRDLDHRKHQAESLQDIGDALSELDRRQEAIEAWTQSLALYEEFGDARAQKIRENLARSG